jgi:hypothetical protein
MSANNEQLEPADEQRPDEESGEQPPTDEDSFPRAYVEQLRAEAAEQRVKAKRADDLLAYAARVAVERYAADILADPRSLTYDDSMADDYGLPDGAKIEQAARALVEARPYLGKPGGDVLQGQHGNGSAGFSWGILGQLV